MENKEFDMKQALNYAIHAEIEANEFYQTWSDNSDDSYIKTELKELADWEASHRDSLKNYFNKTFGVPFERNPEMVVEPALKVQADEFKDSYSLLRIASATYLSEMRAAELYEELEKRSDGEAREMFKELKDMEQGHMKKAKKRYMKMRENVVGFHAF
jgi:rubrerythrin